MVSMEHARLGVSAAQRAALVCCHCLGSCRLRIHYVACQVLAHFLRPGKQATGRAAWGWYHWAVGWTALALATINVFQVRKGWCSS